MAHGFEAIQLNIILKIAAFIFLAPFIGMIVAFGFTLLVLHMLKSAPSYGRGMVQETPTRIFRLIQYRAWIE